MSFERCLCQDQINALKEEDLFRKCLKADIESGAVFPAIRRGSIDFYHAGGRLFRFGESGMETNWKYAFVCNRHTKISDDINETDLEGMKPIRTFLEGYGRIKEVCSRYAQPERKRIAEALKTWSYAKPGQQGKPVVLDIEVRFASSRDVADKDADTGTIDLLVLHPEGRLRFIEAKRFDDARLVARKTQPKVIEQMNGYVAQVKRRLENIKTQYGKYALAVKQLFGVDVPIPTSVDDHMGLLIFDFDTAQKDIVKRQIIPNLGQYAQNVAICAKGNIKNWELRILWNGTSNPGSATTDS